MSWERNKFRLRPKDGTTAMMVPGDLANQLAFYPSTLRHEETGERLMSVAMTGGGRGMRLDVEQVTELRDMLTAYLDHALVLDDDDEDDGA